MHSGETSGHLQGVKEWEVSEKGHRDRVEGTSEWQLRALSREQQRWGRVLEGHSWQ